MSVVDNLAKKNAAVTVQGIVAELARDFFPGVQNKEAREEWTKAWGKRFQGALVGRSDAPAFTDAQISEAYEGLMESWKYNSPPKPAHIAERARELRPMPQLQKTTAPESNRQRWTPEERAANIARVEAIQAFLDSQEPEFRECLHAHGYGSPELRDLQARHKAALQAEVDRLAKVF